MDAFLAGCETEPCDVPCSWGEKTTISVFDEDQVLGQHAPGAPAAFAASGGHSTAAPGEDGVMPRDNGIDAGVPTSFGHLAVPEPVAHNSQSDATVHSMLTAIDGVVHIVHVVPAWSASTRGGYNMMKRMSIVDVLDQDAKEHCPVCLENMCRGEVVWTLPCFHQLHDQCATRLFGAPRIKPGCPICRFSQVSAHFEPHVWGAARWSNSQLSDWEFIMLASNLMQFKCLVWLKNV
jgi:hypothetical protein